MDDGMKPLIIGLLAIMLLSLIAWGEQLPPAGQGKVNVAAHRQEANNNGARRRHHRRHRRHHHRRQGV